MAFNSVIKSLLKDSSGILFCSSVDVEYLESSKRIIHDLIDNSIKVSWYKLESIEGVDEDVDELYEITDSVLNKNIEFDTVVFHCNADEWFSHIEKYKIKFINKKLIGFPIWETNKISDSWVSYINLMNEIWVLNDFNKEVFERCGVETVIKTVCLPPTIQNLPEVSLTVLSSLIKQGILYQSKKTSFEYCDKDWKVFYTIGEWDNKENLSGVVKSYCKAFTNNDKVKLIIKTNHKNYSRQNTQYCINKLNSTIHDYKNHPEILLITSNISRQESSYLHSIGDCYISTTRGSNVNLNVKDAYNYGNEVIITKFGGHSEYFGESYNGLIDYDLVSVDFVEKNHLYTGDQRWANPNEELFIKKLQETYVEDKPISNDAYFCLTESDITRNVIEPDEVEIETPINGITNVINIKIKSEAEFSGITYIGQYGTSGYATATKGNLYYFFNNGIPISWTPLYFDNSTMSDDCIYNVVAKSLISKKIHNVDTTIIHSTPDLWPDFRSGNKKLFLGQKIIGYTVWETSRLPLQWVESINDSVDEVWCPSIYNKLVFLNSGVNIPINVFPHVFLRKELPKKELVIIKLHTGQNVIANDEYYTFYSISELNVRKGVEDLINTFCQTFTKRDKVRLILKVHYKNYDEQNKKFCLTKLNEIISKYKNPPLIQFLINNLTDREILALHSIGDCYVSLTKSEGFGLTIFEAFNYGKKIIATGYSGHMDFLGNTYGGLVEYRLGKLSGMNEFSKYYTDDQEWAYPNLEHAGELMGNCL